MNCATSTLKELHIKGAQSRLDTDCALSPVCRECSDEQDALRVRQRRGPSNGLPFQMPPRVKPPGLGPFGVVGSPERSALDDPIARERGWCVDHGSGGSGSQAAPRARWLEADRSAIHPRKPVSQKEARQHAACPHYWLRQAGTVRRHPPFGPARSGRSPPAAGWARIRCPNHAPGRSVEPPPSRVLSLWDGW